MIVLLLRLAAALALLWAGGVHAALDLDPAAPRQNPAAFARYLEDPQGGLTLAEVRQPGRDWRAVTDEIPHFGYSDSAYWLTFRLRHGGDAPLSRLFEVGYPLLNDVRLYVFDAQGTLRAQYQVGDRLPFDARPVDHRNFLFPLVLQPGEEVELLVRVQTTSSAQLPLTLWEPAAFQSQNKRELLAFGIYAGIMLAMIVYNLFIFFIIRIRAYLYYVLFIAASGLLFVELRGLPFEFLWPNALWWQEHGIALLASAVPLFGSLFAASFLNIRRHSPRLFRALQGVVAVGAANICLTPFVSYPIAIRIAVLTILVWIFLVGAAGIVALIKGEKSARYYNLAWAGFLVAAFLTTVYQFGWISKSVVGEYTLPLGSALEVLLLSFALADRINQMRREKDLAQKEALDSLSRYQALYQEAQYGIFTTTFDGRFVGANPALAALLGYASPEEVVETLSDVGTQLYVDPAARDRMIGLLQRQGYVNGFETEMRRKDGSTVWVAMSVRLREDKGGTLLEGSLTDITERKQRERAERARELAEKEREAATSAARAKGVFLSNMSHEIRTPLTAIIGYGEFLLEPRLEEPKRRELANTIVRSGRHLLEIINDVLDLSKIEAGRLEVERISVDLFELLADVRSVFEARAQQKGLYFRIEHALPLPRRIVTDPTRFKQILYNLCSNAVKFTDSGGITLEVSCDVAAQRLKVAVADTGIGIAPDKIEHIFEAFAQADVSTTRRYGGTGLGLSISRQLAGMLGGRIGCASEPGRGSRFEVTVATGLIDRGALAREPGETHERPVESEREQVPQLRGRILYAEDNRDSQRLVSLLVKATGAAIKVVENGQDAVDLAAREDFDLVLLDIQMPVMDGFGALAALRARGFRKPICALTANVMAEDRASYAAAGFDACEAKPIDRAAFYQLLQRCLPAQEVPLAEAPPPQVAGRVMVAEDNPDTQGLIEWYLKRTGAEVVVVADGWNAVDRGQRESFDLVLLDAQMPAMSGFQAARALRDGGYRGAIYLFSAEPDLESAAREAGCDGHLNKPIEPAELYAVVTRHLPPPAPVAQALPVVSVDLSELREAFVQELPSMLGRMSAAVAAGDWAQTARLAHQLKGSGGSFGYPEITDLSRYLERAAKAGEPDAVTAALAALSQRVEEITSATGA